MRYGRGPLRGTDNMRVDRPSSDAEALTPEQATSINRRVFETSQDLICVTNGYGDLIQVSPSSLAILGYAPEEMIGKSGGAFIFPDDLDSMRNEMRAARRGRAANHFAARYVHKNGVVVPLVWMGVWSELDRYHFFIGRDMTERDRADAQLRQSQKMEVVGQLTGGVAHDFNNILMIIMANADALLEQEGIDSHVHGRLKKIVGATERAAELTRQLLAFSRKQPLRPQHTNLNDLVSTTGNLLRRTLGEHVEIDAILADDLWVTRVDRAQLETALVNLCVNARDAMFAGGRLLIETKNARLDEADAAREIDVSPGDYVLLSVTDNGSGMSPDLLSKVFEPFFTTKPVGKGSGLGLSMVYGFIKQSGGHIKIDSAVGRGTSIRLYLSRAEAGAARAAEMADATMPRGKERILVTEDDAQVRASVVQQLRSLGYEVAEAADGEQALAELTAALQPYDLLLTDFVMPGLLNGMALAEEAGRRRPAMRIVFMSGYSEDAIVQHGRLDPGVRLLAKPFRKIDLACKIRLALDDTAGNAVSPV